MPVLDALARDPRLRVFLGLDRIETIAMLWEMVLTAEAPWAAGPGASAE